MGPDQIGEYVEPSSTSPQRCARIWTPTRTIELAAAAAPEHPRLPLPARRHHRGRGRRARAADPVAPSTSAATAMVAATKVDGRCWLKLTLLNPLATTDDILGITAEVVAVGDELRRGGSDERRPSARLHRHRPRPVQPRPGLPHRPDRRPRRALPRGPRRARLAPRHAARRRHPAGAVPGRPGHHGRPDRRAARSSATSRRPATSTRSTSASRSTRCAGVRRLLPLGRRPARQRPVRAAGSVEHVRLHAARRTSSPPATGEEFRGRRLVLGVGTSPCVPECLEVGFEAR